MTRRAGRGNGPAVDAVVGGAWAGMAADNGGSAGAAFIAQQRSGMPSWYERDAMTRRAARGPYPGNDGPWAAMRSRMAPPGPYPPPTPEQRDVPYPPPTPEQ